MSFFISSFSLFLAVLLAVRPSSATSSCSSIPSSLRLDCHPAPNATQDQCLQRNCCWSPSDITSIPWCFYAPSSGYSVDSGPFWSRDGVTARLRLKAPGPFLSQDITELLFSATFDSNTRLRVRIIDANAARWEPPDIVRENNCGTNKCGAADPLLDIAFTANPFGFAVTRRDDGSVIFNSSVPDVPEPFPTLIYSDQFLSLSSSLPASAKVHGLGEQVGIASSFNGTVTANLCCFKSVMLQIAPLNLPIAGPAGQKCASLSPPCSSRLSDAVCRYTLFAKDQGTPQHSAIGGSQTYGSYPYVMVSDAKGRAHGVMLVNR